MTTKRYVYLAGPIVGCTNGEANDWRVQVDGHFFDSGIGIVGVSPLRCEPIRGERYTADSPDPRFGVARAIAAKNRFDVRNCDITLAYLPKPEPGRVQSYGTLIECAWADAYGKQVVLVSDDPFVLNHPVVDACADWKLGTLDEAVDVCIGVLGGYVPGGKNV